MQPSRTLTARRLCDLLFLPLFLALSLLLAPFNAGVALASITLTSSVTSEGDDFATRVLGLPWDMSTGPYPDFATVFQGNPVGVDRASFAAAGGIWSFTTTTNDPSLLLLSPGIQNTQRVLRLGDRFPIDTSKYKLLSFRLCSSANSTANVHWFYDQAPHSVFASSRFIDITATSGSSCIVYVIDLTQIGLAAAFGGATGWNGLVKGFRLDPISTGSGISLQVDWVRLTTADTSHIVPINWANVGSGTNLFFYLSKDSTCSTSGATLIGTVPRTGSSGRFNWGGSLQPNPTAATPFPLPESFQPGQYAVFVLVDNAGQPVCAASPLDIRKAPLLSFQKPSFFSGPDYATEVVGNPWGMDSAVDVGRVTNLTSFDFTGGVFNALTNSTGDPSYLLHVTAPIETQRYKYLTFRMLLDGAQDIGAGWVHRFIWWYQGDTVDATVTRDMLVYEGWQTYSVDLSQALIEPSSLGTGWIGAPTAFRMDPDEVPAPVTFHVDFVTLTGDERVQSGVPFPIYYQTTPGSGVTVSLFYDTDTNPSNGRTAISVSGSACPSPPSPELNLLTGTCVMWDTTAVPSGTYFISAEVSDGITTTTWYSETRVIVNNPGPRPTPQDFNGDGKADILWRHTSGALYTWFMSGTAIGVGGASGSAAIDWTIQAIADFNGDGQADILWRHTSGALYIWLMNGTSVIGEGSLPGTTSGWTIQAVGDFNGDGKADMLWRHTSGALYVWLMNGTSIIGEGSLPGATTDWVIQRVGDFNGDGKADILWRHTSGAVVVWLMNGTSIVGTGSPGTTSTDWVIADVGDFNGDGKADILWRNSSSGLVYIWLMNGTAIGGDGSPGSAGSDWTIRKAVDFNGDGKADILWRHTSGALYIWLMNGTAIIGDGSPGGATSDWTIQ
jgi:hypothetical protein